MNYVNKPEKFDEVVEEEGVKLIIDSKALMAVVGTELDYVVTDTSEEFVFKNPNEKVRTRLRRENAVAAKVFMCDFVVCVAMLNQSHV